MTNNQVDVKNIKPNKFKLSNGLQAKVIPLDQKGMEQVRKAVIKTCREYPMPHPDFQLDPSRFCVVEVVVCNEKVSFVYLLEFVPSWLEYKRLRLLDKSVAKTLYMYFRDDLNAIIDLPGYAVYKGVAYPSSKNVNRFIKTAIKNAMSPSVAILMLNSKK